MFINFLKFSKVSKTLERSQSRFLYPNFSGARTRYKSMKRNLDTNNKSKSMGSISKNNHPTTRIYTFTLPF